MSNFDKSLNKIGSYIFKSLTRQIISAILILVVISIIIILTPVFYINISLLIISLLLYLISCHISKNHSDDILRLISYILIIISGGGLWKDAIENVNYCQITILSIVSLIIIIAILFVPFLIKNKQLNDKNNLTNESKN
ncbi:Uncharacterised protein [Proteus vulgaris]|uniref:hypothetical protein n=1 Tax=Proteus vulgaris TaxID=585 RepID=UPI000DFF697E|nr:hypothetical protein [Proteus vulgaris]SUC01460.1 Uncharacterised protein [Proteus vulgaris]